MNKTLLVLPYFGKFKNYFRLFLFSFSFNINFDLLIITDQDISNALIPTNVFVKKMRFIDFRDFIQAHFDFPICLTSPYKLCDFKPSYGYLLQDFEWFQKYKYWGYCDCDLIFGDLSPISQLEQKNFMKIFANGHLTIYKNTLTNNTAFMLPLENRFIFKEAFTTDKIYGFDEGGTNYLGEMLSVHEIFTHYHPNATYSGDLSFNASTSFDQLHNCRYAENKKGWISEKKATILHFNKGKLYSNKTEYIYCHLQNRKMKIFCDSFSSFDISSYSFIKAHSFFWTFISKCMISSKFMKRIWKKVKTHFTSFKNKKSRQEKP